MAKPILTGRLLFAAVQGGETGALGVIEACESAAIARGEGVVLTFGELGRAVLHNGLGRYEAAVGAAESASGRDELMASGWALPELVEAASRCGRTQVAAEALAMLSERTRAAGTNFALGTDAGARALLSEGERADELHRESIERLSRTRMRLPLARAHLTYGEALRRGGRRTDARKHLRIAYETLTAMGIEGFSERARVELQATGETVRKRSVETLDDLTPQEAQVARLARDGLTNPEIAAQLFISPRTVEWHLRKVFTKTGVTSRRDLHKVLPEGVRAVQA